MAGENVDTSKSELVCKISDAFLTSCVESFRPYIPEAKGDAHKNVQVISTLASLPIDSGLTAEDYRVVFIFEDAAPESTEAVYLKLLCTFNWKSSFKKLKLKWCIWKLHNCAWLETNQ